ncbi:MAG: 2-succinyl-5-enolpyruvyl-6-hydroxy-3-cyclohexene-1-carboxylic-acid synthase [bacterium]|nr:2-succinyl-5-enolpyruvyl-6-hydroxy-3-cyclohexene-1-carboxylic-acid synthase [bacterium]
MTTVPDPNTAFASALWSGLVEAGVARVCVCSGSRSAPLAVAAAWQPGLDVSVHLDERSAGFIALGAARAERRPVALVCTSGTAAANFLPAVVEASHAGVPLIVLTADRPPELRGWGAAQTIDQHGIFGSRVRWGAELPPPGTDSPGPAYSRALAARCVAEASEGTPGPVHLNVPFREPLHPNAASLAVSGAPSSGRAVQRPAVARGPMPEAIALLAEKVGQARHGVLIAGPCPDADPRLLGEAALAFASSTGWPVLAEVPSQLRAGPGAAAGIVLAGGEALVRNSAFASANPPDVVLRLGAPTTSKAMHRWMAAHPEAEVIAIDAEARFQDPAWRVDHWVSADPCAVLQALAETFDGGVSDPAWLHAFRAGTKAAMAALASSVADCPGLPAARVVQELARELPADAGLFLSNGLAIRHADLFLPARSGPLRVFANRGANGIDGIVSTALGASLGCDSMTLLTGDLAFLHDLSGLLAAKRMKTPLVIVVLDDDGGGIFDHLPIAELGESVRFEELFRTPHGADLEPLVEGFGVPFHQAVSPESFRRALQAARDIDGPTVIRVGLDPKEQRAIQERALALVDTALREGGLV